MPIQFTPRDCCLCGVPLIRNKSGHGMCSACYHRDFNTRNRVEIAAKALARKLARAKPLACVDCGVSFPWPQTRRKRCQPCRVLAHRMAWRAKQPVRPNRCAQCDAPLIPDQNGQGLCARCYHKAYYAAHREETKQRTSVYAATHREECNARSRAYYAAHPERKAETYRRYSEKHPDKQREIVHRRRARERDAFVAPVRFADIWERDRGICQICHRPAERKLASLDHILPLACGGTHEPANVRIAHRKCNNKRLHRGTAQLRMIG